MQTYKINSNEPDFIFNKPQLDARVAQYKQDKKAHSVGTIKHWVLGVISSIDYIYNFSTEDKKE